MNKTIDSAKISFDVSDGGLTIRLPGFELTGCRASAEWKDQRVCAEAWQTLEKTETSLRLLGRFPFGTLTLTIRPVTNRDGVSGIAMAPALDLTEPVERDLRIAVLDVPVLSATHVIEHGRRMGRCGLHPLPVESLEFVSHFQVLVTRGDWTLQLSNPLRQHDPAQFAGRVEGDRLLDFRAETVVSRTGPGRLDLAPIRLFSSRDGHGLMTAYGESERTVDAPRPERLQTGWNTWDYYRWTITEDEVLKNAELIRNDPVLSRHIHRIIVDDGWQYCYGEWEPNPLFPSGMEELARNIKVLGFEPGLWIAPTIIEPHSRIAQLQPDWLAKTWFGEPILAFSCMKRNGFLLDPTQPRVKAWLRDLFRRYCDMGFTYFKLDFLGSTLEAPVFADASVGRGEIMRHILEPIREATLGRARILGCNYMFDGGDDLVDGVRTSGDIHATWEAVRGNVRSIAARFWMQGRLWDNDPDFAVCRGPDTSEDPLNALFKPSIVYYTPDCREPNPHIASIATARYEEAVTLLSLVVISGGSVNLSDCLYKLNARGLDLVRKTVAFERG
ncbi:MAG: glycoside hydrolase family 36 protein, partial [Kiritimatiellia bacterium]|nr:glycoside hydrolase family 36 protein [Kiritimatiellia bacterium]